MRDTDRLQLLALLTVLPPLVAQDTNAQASNIEFIDSDVPNLFCDFECHPSRQSRFALT